MEKLPAGVWVVIPAYNESTYIERVLQRLSTITKRIVVIDDGSQDETYNYARAHAPHVLRHRINLGKGAALKTGCEYAFEHLGAHGVIFFDADDQHDPTLLISFATALDTVDVAVGVRSFSTRMPLYKIILNRIASFAVYLVFGAYIPDIPCGYKALTKRAYQKINWKSRDYAVEMEIAARTAQYKLSFCEIAVPTVYHDLDRGMTILDTIGIIPQFISWRLFR